VKRIRELVRLTGLLLLFLVAMHSAASTARASEPKIDYWFIETLSVSDVDLPAGIEIFTSNPPSQPRGSLVVTNRTETLLFVMSLRYKDVLVMATPDPGFKAQLNAAHEVASYLVAPNRPAYLSIEALTDLDQNLADRNVLTFDPPPTDVSIPTAQSSELLLVYDGQVVEVPFKLTYTLNTRFNNGTGANLNGVMNTQATDDATAKATQKAETFASDVMRNNIKVIGLVGVAVLFIAGWLVWRRLRRSR
jgi:hypothetical protein